MRYDPEKHHRRSIRLKGYDYTQSGAYFVTMCTHERECLFGGVTNGQVQLSRLGEIVYEEWFRTAELRPYVCLYPDEFVVMPNHIHGIIWIVESTSPTASGTGTAAPRPDNPAMRPGPSGRMEQFGRPVSGSIPTIVRAFKAATTKRINEQRNTPGAPVWQRNYYEHVIRNNKSLLRIRAYILANPDNWIRDPEYRAQIAQQANDSSG